MAGTERITMTMTMREVDRLKVIEAVAECRLEPGQVNRTGNRGGGLV